MRISSLIFSFIFSATLLVTFHSTAQELKWELRFPFKQMGKYHLKASEKNRYFSDSSIGERDWSFRRDMYFAEDCRNKNQPILCSEEVLGETRISKMFAAIKKPKKSEYGSTKSNAWLAEAYLDRGNGYSGSKYRYLENYVSAPNNPNAGRHRVRVWINDESLKGKRCEFRIINAIDWTEADCYEGSSVLSIARGNSSSTIEGRLRGSSEMLSLSGEQTKVREVLIAAVGDSYASGEGAPDIPAKVKFVGRDIKRIPAEGVTNKNDLASSHNAAHWVERNCHRSYLSSQARAIIHYAATHPHTETTMLHVACSGAEVISGLLGPYSGASETNGDKRKIEGDGGKNTWRTTLSQYNQLIMALCRDPDKRKYIDGFNEYFYSRAQIFPIPKSVRTLYRENGRNLPIQEWNTERDTEKLFKEKIECRGGFKKKIDALLIGVGGNDAGFFDTISHALIDPGLIRTFSGAIKPERAGKLVKRRIKALYRFLDEANESWLNMERESVILSLYPLGLTDKNKNFCNSDEGLSSFNIVGNLFGYGNLAKANAPDMTHEESELIYSKFGTILNQEILDYVSENPGWNVSKDHVKWFDGHGWCAGNAEITRNSNYNAFELTDRWLRTPDDGYASQHRLPVDFEKKRSRLLNSMLKTYGLMHPNGLGAAAMADSYYKQLVKVLND